ncbi:MAG: glycyl-radical enzyme activating protein [Bacteroidales bacterium]|nr:glycyl-radical enzyme activating protein [Bacteroidales bacterium]
MKGIIFDIKHYAIHDGPGIRQTVFLKGCPLSCWWCHNPESRSREIFSYEKEESIDGRKICQTETVGQSYSVSALMAEIGKDRIFFEESGGGITFSGGEPLLQFDFLMEVLKKCRQQEIHTCVDTTGFVAKEKMKATAELTDLFLFDLKQMDDELHRQYTGVSNRLILENLKILDAMGKEIWVRYPLIPGFNDDESQVFRMLDFLSRLQKKPPVQLLPYHKIGKHKYTRFGIDYKMKGVEEPSQKHIEKTKKYFEDAGFAVRVGG